MFDYLHPIFSPPYTWKPQIWSLFLWVCFWSITIYLQHYVNFCYTMWLFDISVHFKMINMVFSYDMLLSCKGITSYWLYSLLVTFLCNYKFIPFNLPYLFFPSHTPFPSNGQPPVCFLYLRIYFCFIMLFICFLGSIFKIIRFLSLCAF